MCCTDPGHGRRRRNVVEVRVEQHRVDRAGFECSDPDRDGRSVRSLPAVASGRDVRYPLSRLVLIERCFIDQGACNPLHLVVAEHVAVIPGHAVGRDRFHPALEQSQLPDSQHASIVDDRVGYAL
jgi:hypothetical protein